VNPLRRVLWRGDVGGVASRRRGALQQGPQRRAHSVEAQRRDGRRRDAADGQRSAFNTALEPALDPAFFAAVHTALDAALEPTLDAAVVAAFDPTIDAARAQGEI